MVLDGIGAQVKSNTWGSVGLNKGCGGIGLFSLPIPGASMDEKGPRGVTCVRGRAPTMRARLKF